MLTRWQTYGKVLMSLTNTHRGICIPVLGSKRNPQKYCEDGWAWDMVTSTSAMKINATVHIRWIMTTMLLLATGDDLGCCLEILPQLCKTLVTVLDFC